MPFKDQLQEKLKNKIPPSLLQKIPTGFQRVGDIIILNLDESLHKYKKEIAEVVLELFPSVKTICNKTGGIQGQFREPQIEYLAGEKDTTTRHIESGCIYKFDVTKIMFAKGNLAERVRVPKQVKKGEIILDMFAGIGYFSIPLGKLSQAQKIYAVELNPLSFKFLEENIALNKLKNVEAIHADNREVITQLIQKKIKVDRIIMGYLPPPKEFLPHALSIIKKGGMIHYEDIISVDKKDEEIQLLMREINAIAEKYGFTAQFITAKCIKSYGPKKDHYVFDIKIS